MEDIKEKTNVAIFDAIKDLVLDLKAVFNSSKPLLLYHRLITRVERGDLGNGSEIHINKYIDGFKIFFANYDSFLESDESIKNIPRDTFIRYADSNNIGLEIQKYIYMSATKPKQLNIIRTHLLTISALIAPSEKTLTALDGAPLLEKLGYSSNSHEAEFVKSVLARAKKTMSKTSIDDNSDPTKAISTLLGSGLLQDVIGELDKGCKDKTINPDNLMDTFQHSIMESFGEDGENIDISKITIAIQQSMKDTNIHDGPDAMITAMHKAIGTATGLQLDPVNPEIISTYTNAIMSQNESKVEEFED